MAKAQTATTATVEGFDIPTIAKSIGTNMVDLQVSTATTDSLVSTLQETATKLRDKGIKFGKSIKTCTWRSTINDTIQEKCKDKKAQKTCMNYLTSFVSAVNNGTKFSLSDSKGKAKSGGAKKSPEFSALLAKAYAHKEFQEFINELQEGYENADFESLFVGIQSYLIAEDAIKIEE